MFSRKDTPGLTPQPLTIAGSAQHAKSAESVSLIREDMKIFGNNVQITSEQPVQINGEIQGDVLGKRVIVGQTGFVKGMVNAEAVHIDGKVEGTVRGLHVSLSTTAHVSGDIYHQTLTLAMGANFEGRSRKAKDEAELLPNFPNTVQSTSEITAATHPDAGSSIVVPSRKLDE